MEKAHDAVDYTKGKAYDAAEYTKEKVVDLAEYAKETTLKKLKETGSYVVETTHDAVEFTKEKIHDAIDYTKEIGHEAFEFTVANAYGTVEVVDIADATKETTKEKPASKDDFQGIGVHVVEKAQDAAAQAIKEDVVSKTAIENETENNVAPKATAAKVYKTTPDPMRKEKLFGASIENITAIETTAATNGTGADDRA